MVDTSSDNMADAKGFKYIIGELTEASIAHARAHGGGRCGDARAAGVGAS